MGLRQIVFPACQMAVSLGVIVATSNYSDAKDVGIKIDIEEIRQALQPFNTPIEKSAALVSFLCGGLVRSSVHGDKKTEKTVSGRAHERYMTMKDGRIILVVPLKNSDKDWDDATTYVKITDLERFSQTRMLRFANKDFIIKYFVEGLTSKNNTDRIEATSPLDLNFYFENGKVSAIEAQCDANN